MCDIYIAVVNEVHSMNMYSISSIKYIRYRACIIFNVTATIKSKNSRNKISF
jgi:hypothetical protein